MTTSTKADKKNGIKKAISRITIVLIVCLMFPLASGCTIEEKTSSAEAPVYTDYSTYVFFGTDSRAEGDEWKTDAETGTEGAPSSDVIMLLTINNESDEAKIVSVYRDTMLDVAGDGSDFEKCNTAYREGGAYGAIDMLERNLDLHIDGYVTANFMAVAKAIDLLGGIEVDVEDEETTELYRKYGNDVVDIMNRSIDEMNSVYGENTPHVEHAGKQTLTGLQAVAYSRVRYTAGLAIERTHRQENIVMLMAEKLKASDTEKQHSVLKEMYKTVDTDMDESEMMSLFDTLVGYDIGDVDGFPFKLDQVNDENKGALLVPCDLITNVTELHAFMYNNDSYEPSKTVSEYSGLITDETGLTSEDANAEISSY